MIKRTPTSEMFVHLEKKRKEPLVEAVEWYLDIVFKTMEDHKPSGSSYVFEFDTGQVFLKSRSEVKAIKYEVVDSAVAQLKLYGYVVTYITDHDFNGIRVKVVESNTPVPVVSDEPAKVMTIKTTTPVEDIVFSRAGSCIDKTPYEVNIIESERGWGSKVDEVIYFENEEYARKFVHAYNAKHNSSSVVPDWYMAAHYMG